MPAGRARGRHASGRRRSDLVRKIDAASLKGGPVSRRIDANRQATRDSQSRSHQLSGEFPRVVFARGGGITRADDGHLRKVEHVRIATNKQSHGRIGQLGEQPRITRRGNGNEVMCRLVEPAQIRLDQRDIRCLQISNESCARTAGFERRR